MKLPASLLAVFAMIGQPADAQSETAGKSVEVMVLGSYHFANPGRDIANVKADDVTQPGRQAELATLASALSGWKPTKVLVETQQPAPFTVPQYRTFKRDDLKSKRNEIVQIGFRLANMMGHKEVYGFDEQPGEGEPDYFQFGKISAHAEASGKKAEVDALIKFFQDKAAEDERAQAHHSIAEMLLRHNDREAERIAHGRGHYSVLHYGDSESQVGAEFNSFWYMRNAKMFAKIAMIAQPGDRLLVLVGSGHNYWLRHFASDTPGFVNVDPVPLLRAAAQKAN